MKTDLPKTCLSTLKVAEHEKARAAKEKERGEAKGHIKMTDYRRAYAGMLPEKSCLDDIFMEHNRDTRPFGCKMRSMSVSDIVVATRAGKKHAYYVDNAGYEQVDELLQPKQPQRVGYQPKKKRSEPER